MVKHQGCKASPDCRRYSAYIRVERKWWVKIGEYYTKCGEFHSKELEK